MKKFLTIFGLLLLLIPCATHGAGDVLLDKIQSLVAEESTVSDRVAAFTADTLNAAKLSYLDGSAHLSLTGDAVKKALAKDQNGLTDDSLCTAQKLKSTLACILLMSDMQKIADREMETTTLGDRLQSVATSYEDPISDFSLEPRKLTSAYGETLGIWGIPQVAQHPELTIRLMPVPNDASSVLDPLHASLDALVADGSDEERVAAVWRYVYGLHFVESKSDSTDPDKLSGDDTERRFLFKRWDTIEKELSTIKTSLSSSIDPPLSKGEVAFFLIPLDTKGTSNVSIWAYIRDTSIDKTAGITDLPPSDVGLRWDTALKPVLPSLMSKSKKGIPGGLYPPPPEKNVNGDTVEKGGGGLCESLAGSQGYLCHARTTLSAADDCVESAPKADTGVIILSSCTPKAGAKSPDADLTDLCTRLRNDAGGGDVCAPGNTATYPYSILGDACFVRECAERSYGHRLTPGRIPLVSQETTAPWSGCSASAPAAKTTEISPLIALPHIPEYNPALRLHEFNTQYCQSNGKPPLALPVLCGPDLSTAIEYPHMQDAGNGFMPGQVSDPLLEDDYRQQAEAMGLERGASLYRDYLEQANATFAGNLSATVAMLKTLASSTFPTAMCPLNPQDDRAVCSVSSPTPSTP